MANTAKYLAPVTTNSSPIENIYEEDFVEKKSEKYLEINFVIFINWCLY